MSSLVSALPLGSEKRQRRREARFCFWFHETIWLVCYPTRKEGMYAVVVGIGIGG
jgi:hypothetical protein